MQAGSFGAGKNRQNGRKRPRTSTDFPTRTQEKRGKILKNQINDSVQYKIDTFVDFETGEAAAVAFDSGNVRGGRERENQREIDKMVENQVRVASGGRLP